MTSILETKQRDINVPAFLADFAGIIGSAYSLLTKRHMLLNRQKVKLSKPKFRVCSNEQAKRDFNFTPTYTVEEGLRATFEWYKQKGLLFNQ